VTRPEPLAGIAVAVTRRSGPGEPAWAPHERLTVEQALRAATSGAQSGEDPRVAVGARADLVLLAEDPRAVPVPDLADIEVLATWCGGIRRH
jgi:predicted amidohydrolase YtcJ